MSGYVLDINSVGCRRLNKLMARVTESNEDPLDILSALCLGVGFIIDAGVSGEDKQELYELTLRTLAKIMSVAPGHKK